MAEPVLTVDEQAEIQKAIDAYEERSWELAIAAGYGVRTNPLINSGDIPMYAALDIAWFGDWFFFDNGDLGVNVHESSNLSVNFIAHLNDERVVFEWFKNIWLGDSFAIAPAPDGSDENPVASINNTGEPVCCSDPAPLSDMGFPTGVTDQELEIPKRSLAVDGGLEIVYVGDWGDIQLQVLTDLSFTHKGAEIWASYAYPWQYGNWKAVPSVGINWKSHNLLNYYYGIRDSEKQFNRSAYTAESGVNSFVKLSIAYRFNENWGAVGIAEYETLSRGIRRSPIVDKDGIGTLFIGLMYKF